VNDSTSVLSRRRPVPVLMSSKPSHTSKGYISSFQFFVLLENDPVLETALHGRAHVLCTLERHFHHRTVLENCGKHCIEVLTDVELLS